MIRVEKHATEALIDTGTECSMISEPFASSGIELYEPLKWYYI